MYDTKIPADIVEMVDLLASIEGRTGNEYANRWWADLRTATAMRGGIEAMEAEIASRKITTEEEPQ